MTPEKWKLLHRICSIVTAVLLVVLAACLVISCILVYYSGDRPFTPEIVGKVFQHLAIPGVLLLISVLLGLFLPIREERIKPIREKSGKCPRTPSPAQRRLLRIGFAALGLALILLGISNRGYADVLGKAIRICQECIGIG